MAYDELVIERLANKRKKKSLVNPWIINWTIKFHYLITKKLNELLSKMSWIFHNQNFINVKIKCKWIKIITYGWKWKIAINNKIKASNRFTKLIEYR